MKIILLTAVLLTFAQLGFGQKKVHQVNLIVESNFIEEDWYIDDIIDKRAVKDNIGFVYTGFSNKRMPAVLPKNTEEYLKKCTDRMFVFKNGTPIVLLVHGFEVSEVTKLASEEGNFHYDFEFAIREGENLLSLARIEGKVITKGLDVTLGHSMRISKGLTNAFIEFRKSNWKDKQGELIDQSPTMPYDHTVERNVGLYASFEKLAKNEPFLTEGFHIVERNDFKVRLVAIVPGNEDQAKKAMFAWDGENLYMHSSKFNSKDYLTKSLIVGKLIYFEDQYPDVKGTLLFGAVGGGLISSSNRGIVLDTETGLIHLIDQSNTMKFIHGYPEIRKTFSRSSRHNSDIRRAICSINSLYK